MDYIDKTLALLLWAKDDVGEDDVAVFSGTLICENSRFYLSRKNGEKPEILAEWLPRIQAVSAEQREMLQGCKYFISLSIGNLDDDTENVKMFGLKWPE